VYTTAEATEFYRSTLTARHPSDLPLCGTIARHPDAAPIFRQLAMEDAPLVQRARAIDALKCMDDPDTDAFLLEVASDTSLPPLMRAEALRVATDTLAVGEWRTVLVEAVIDPDPRVSKAAAGWVVKTRDPGLLEAARAGAAGLPAEAWLK